MPVFSCGRVKHKSKISSSPKCRLEKNKYRNTVCVLHERKSVNQTKNYKQQVIIPSFCLKDNSIHFRECSPFWLGISTICLY